MLIKNIKSGRKLTATKADWEQIMATGNAYKYEVIENDSPLEVRSMRSKVAEKPAEIKEEIKAKPKK